MDRIPSIFEQPLIQCVGLTLLHFIWQGALVACCLAVALRWLRNRNANARYVISVAALLLTAALPVLTLLLCSSSGTTRDKIDCDATQRSTSDLAYLLHAAPDKSGDFDASAYREMNRQGQEPPTGLAVDSSSESTATPRDPSGRLGTNVWNRLVAVCLPWTVLCWLIGVSLLSLRLAGSWFQILRLKRKGTRTLLPSLLEQARRLSRQLGIRRTVLLLESSRTAVPCLIGYLRPVILLPPSAITGLSPEQLETILLHELAHVRRHDFLVMILQVIVETLLFYHPAVWWVSHRIRVERENCCDDMVVSLVKSRLLYARALADMAHLAAAQNQLTAAASGASVIARIHRIMGVVPDEAAPSAPSWIGFLLLTLLAGTVATLSLHLTTPPARAEQTAPLEDANDEDGDEHAMQEGSAANSPPFRVFDDFDAELHEDWEIIHPDPEKASLTKNPGKLTLTSQYGGLHANENGADPPAKNLYLLRNPAGSGDFVATTRLDGFRANLRWQQAGIHIYDDDDNYFKAFVGYGHSRPMVGISWESRGVFGGRDMSPPEADRDSVWLRIIKRGNAYEAFYSLDGDTYRGLGERLWGNGTPRWIGLAAMNEDGTQETLDAAFEFFEIRSLTPEEANNPAYLQRRQLFGSWQTALTADDDVAANTPLFTRFAFDGSEVTISDPRTSLSSPFLQDPDETPSQFTLSYGDRGLIRCIYRRDGDRLTVCMSTRLNSPAPSEFKSGEGQMLVQLDRMSEVETKAIARNRLSPKTRFRVLDADKDAFLTQEEFLADFPAPTATQQGVQLFGIVDQNGDGRIDPNEFQTWPRKASAIRHDLNADGGLSEREFILGDLPKTSRNRGRLVFRLTDQDGNGQVSPDEFISRPAESWFARLDTNEDERVSYAEYADGNGKLVQTRRCRVVFNAIDKDSDGSLSLKEYVDKGPEFSFLKMEGLGNGDGRMSLDEFTTWMQSSKERDAAEAAFKKKDVDGDGTLSLEEFLDKAVSTERDDRER